MTIVQIIIAAVIAVFSLLNLILALRQNKFLQAQAEANGYNGQIVSTAQTMITWVLLLAQACMGGLFLIWGGPVATAILGVVAAWTAFGGICAMITLRKSRQNITAFMQAGNYTVA